MPGLNELTQVMNRTQSITQLSTNSASVEVLSMPDLPRLNATLNLQREKNFRLRTSLPIVFAGIDMGSNSESFWFEVPEEFPKRSTMPDMINMSDSYHELSFPWIQRG